MAGPQSGAWVLGDTIQPYSITTDKLSPSVGDAFLQVSENLSDVESASASLQNIQIGALFNATPADNVVTLLPNNFGAICQISNGANTSVFIPDGIVGFITIRFIGAGLNSGFICTIASSGGYLIAGQSSLILGSGDGVSLFSDGANWWIQDLYLQPVNFNASLSASVTLVDSTPTVILFDTVNFQVGNTFYNTGTGIFTPTGYPGKYTIQTQSGVDTTGAASVVSYTLSLLQNGSSVQVAEVDNVLTSEAATLSCAQYWTMDGITDYLSVSASQTNSTTSNILIKAGSNFSATRTSLF